MNKQRIAALLSELCAELEGSVGTFQVFIDRHECTSFEDRNRRFFYTAKLIATTTEEISTDNLLRADRDQLK